MTFSWIAKSKLDGRVKPGHGVVSGRFLPRLDFGEVVGAQVLDDVADFEFPRADFADGCHFRRGADDEALLEA
jgi:hypothetical protein